MSDEVKIRVGCVYKAGNWYLCFKEGMLIRIKEANNVFRRGVVYETYCTPYFIPKELL